MRRGPGVFRPTITGVRAVVARSGGPLAAEEQTALAAHPWFADALRVRRWDEEAKDPQAKVQSLAAWVPLLEKYFGPQTVSRA